MPTSALTVSLWSVLETEGEDDLGVVLEELGGERVPPQIVALLRSLLQPFVHLVDPIVGLQDEWMVDQILQHHKTSRTGLSSSSAGCPFFLGFQK